MEDASVNAPPSVWGRVVVSCYDRHGADSVVAEVNFGGAMVEQVVQAAASEARMRIKFREVRAARGKVVRAEPVASLYDTGRVHHVGSYQELEDELIAFTTAGYMGDGSPDRADALVWGLTELFPRVIRKDASSFSSHSGWMKPEIQIGHANKKQHRRVGDNSMHARRDVHSSCCMCFPCRSARGGMREGS